MDTDRETGCPKELKLSTSPSCWCIATAYRNTWSAEFLQQLRQYRPEELIPTINYGVNFADLKNSKNFYNTYGKLSDLAGVLDRALYNEMESSNAVRRQRWAFSRFDVLGHSQGGLLARLLCASHSLTPGRRFAARKWLPRALPSRDHDRLAAHRQHRSILCVAFN